MLKKFMITVISFTVLFSVTITSNFYGSPRLSQVYAQVAPSSTSRTSGSFTISSRDAWSLASSIVSISGFPNVGAIMNIASILLANQTKTIYYIYTQTGTRNSDGTFTVNARINFYQDATYQKYITGTSYNRTYEPWER